jgi:hypothetical protein
MDPDRTAPSADAPAASPTGRRAMAVLAWVCALAAPVPSLAGYGLVLGLAGMVLGSGAHLKGDRWGMPAAVVAGITTIAAMTLVFLFRP